jgi:hypothetical protein
VILNLDSWTRHFLCSIGVCINRISGSDPHYVEDVNTNFTIKEPK